ncbi:hypothetical protein F5Y14DRAFT_417120 [Nemania sp. NC0429]|nr:hypothetical protein F5Y14DRAFT_417120 [Nemania sp. NC0429]
MAPLQSRTSSLSLRFIRRYISQARSIGNISNRGHRSLHLYHRTCTCSISSRWARSNLPVHLNRSFVSLPPSQCSKGQPAASIGMEWYDLFTERKIQWLVSTAGDAKWGWVVYRTCYKPEFDSAWEIIKSAAEDRARRRIARSDAPDILDKMDWVFVEDPESLEGASHEELKCRFREWSRAENPGWDIDEEMCSRGSRYSFFIQVDEPALLSIATSSNSYPAGATSGPYVKIVRGWDDPVISEAAAAEGDSDGEDWMKLHMSTLDIDFYVELDNDEAWYSFYTPPDSIHDS